MPRRGQLQPVKDRLDKLSKLDPVSGCILWTGTLSHGKHQYGLMMLSQPRRIQMVHRLAYELHTGAPIPEHLEIKHKCQNAHCINPEHLYASPRNEAKTQCPNGHPYSHVDRVTGARVCKICRDAKYRSFGERYHLQQNVKELEEIVKYLNSENELVW